MCKWCPWRRVVADAEGLRQSGRVRWADGYLDSLIAGCRSHGHISQGQQKAVAGIAMQAERSEVVKGVRS